jgi:hypothetical protein
MEMGFVAFCVHYLGVPSVFLLLYPAAWGGCVTGGISVLAQVVTNMWVFLFFSLDRHGMPFGLGLHGRARGEMDGDIG